MEEQKTTTQQTSSDNLKNIYDKSVEKLGLTSTYDEFVDYWDKSDDNKRKVYDKAVSDLGLTSTYDEFLSYAGATKQQSSPTDYTSAMGFKQPVGKQESLPIGIAAPKQEPDYSAIMSPQSISALDTPPMEAYRKRQERKRNEDYARSLGLEKTKEQPQEEPQQGFDRYLTKQEDKRADQQAFEDYTREAVEEANQPAELPSQWDNPITPQERLDKMKRDVVKAEKIEKHNEALTQLAEQNGINLSNYNNLAEAGEEMRKLYDLTPSGKQDKEALERSVQLAQQDFINDYIKNGTDEELKAWLMAGETAEALRREGDALQREARYFNGTAEQAADLDKRIKDFEKKAERHNALLGKDMTQKFSEAFAPFLEKDEYYQATADKYNRNLTASTNPLYMKVTEPVRKQMADNWLAELTTELNEARPSSGSIREFAAAADILKDTRAFRNAANKNGLSTGLRSAYNTIADWGNATWGIVDAANQATVNDVMKKLDKDGYDKLKPAEQALVDAVAVQDLVYGLYNNDVNQTAWGMGETTAQMAQFIAELYVSGGLAGAARGAVKGGVKQGIKGIGKGWAEGWRAAQMSRQEAAQLGRIANKYTNKSALEVAKNLGKKALKVTDTGLSYALTTGAGHSVANTLEYMAPELDFDYDFNTGEAAYNGAKGGDRLGIAALKGFGKQAIEGGTEVMGDEFFEPLVERGGAWLMRALGKGGRNAYKPYLRVVDDWVGGGVLKNIQGYGIEYGEELAGSVLRALTGISSWDEEFNKENLAQTAYGLMPAQIGFAMLGGGRMVGHNRRASRARALMEKYAPEQQDFYNRVAEMSTYDGADMLDRRTLDILETIDKKRADGSLTKADEQKAAAELGMIFATQEQLYMDEAAAYMDDKKQRSIYEGIASNINKDNGKFTVANWTHDGQTERVAVLSTKDGKATIKANGKKHTVDAKDISVQAEYTPEQAVELAAEANEEDWRGMANEDQTTPRAGSIYYDAEGNTPIVPGGGRVMVTEVADNGDVTFETEAGRQKTMSRRQFYDYMRALRENYEDTAGEIEAWQTSETEVANTTAQSDNAMEHQVAGQAARDVERLLAQKIGADQVALLSRMDVEGITRAYLEAEDDTTRSLISAWLQTRTGTDYHNAMAKRKQDAVAGFKQSIGRLAYDNSGITTAKYNGNTVAVESNDGSNAVVVGLDGSKTMVPSASLANMQPSTLDAFAEQAVAPQLQQADALEKVYDGTVFNEGQVYDMGIDKDGKPRKVAVVSVNPDGTISYATNYGWNKDGSLNPDSRSVNIVSAEDFRDMIETANEEAVEKAEGERQAAQQRADMGSLKAGQRVVIMDGGKPVGGVVMIPYTGQQAVFTDTQKLVNFDTMDDLKKSIQEAQMTVGAASQLAKESVIVEQSEMEKEYQRRLDEAKTPEDRAIIIQEYLDQIKTEDFTMLTDDNYEAAMRNAGANETDIADFRKALAITRRTGQRVRGFNLEKGGIFIHANGIASIEDARTTYVHERQHTITRNNVPLQEQILRSATEAELKRYVSLLSGGSTFYNDKSADVVAQEFISMAMEVAYMTADVEAALRGMGINNDALIQTIKQLDNEQRTEGRLSESRRGSLGNESQQRDNRNDVSDTGGEPTNVGEPRPRPAGGSNEEAGGSQEVSPLDKFIAKWGDNADNKLNKTIAAINKEIANLESKLADELRILDDMPEPFNEETQKAFDKQTKLVDEVGRNLEKTRKALAPYVAMREEMDARFDEWMNQSYDNEAETMYSVQDKALEESIGEERTDEIEHGMGIGLGGEVDGQPANYSVTAGFEGAGLQIMEERDGEKYHMEDDKGNVIAKMGGKTFSADNPITTEDLKTDQYSSLNVMIDLALKAGNITEERAEGIRKTYADILNMFLEAGSAKNGGFDNLASKWMWLGETVFRTVAENGDKQYSYSLDITRVCKKNEAVIRAISELQKRQLYGVTPSQILDLYEATYEAGYQVPCPVCYVFSRYLNNGMLASAAINGMRKYGEHLKGGTDEWTAEQWEAELKRLQQEEEKYNSKLDKAKSDIKHIFQAIDRRSKEYLDPKTTEKRKATLKKQIDKLSREYQAAVDIINQTGLKNWIKSFAIQQVDSQWVLREDAVMPTDMAAFIDMALDFRKVGEAARTYPAIGRLRRSRGSVGGKEITFESNNEFGEVVSGIGRSNLKDYPNVFKAVGEAKTEEERAKAMKAAQERFDAAVAYAKQQSLRGGQRMWSWSDNIESLAPDIALNLIQMEMVGGALQSYSKQLEGVAMVAAMDGYVNGSLMAHDNGWQALTDEQIEVVDGKEVLKNDIEQTISEPTPKGRVERTRVLAEKGSPVITLEDGTKAVLLFDDIIGIDAFGRDDNGKHKKGLFDLNKEYDRAGNILVGMNDNHIIVALADDRVFFVIPWHSSGNTIHMLNSMLGILGQRMGNKTDYTEMQEETDYLEKKDGKFKHNVTSGVKAIWDAHTYEDEFASGIGHIANGDGKGRLSKAQVRYRELRNAIFDGKVSELSAADQRAIEKDAFLSQVKKAVEERTIDKEMKTDDKGFIYPYEYWDMAVSEGDADINGKRYAEYCRRLGYKPKFSGKIKKDGSLDTSEGNFIDVKGYWKLLIDRRMYDRQGAFQDLTPVSSERFNTSYLDQDRTKEEYVSTEVANESATHGIVNDVIERESERLGLRQEEGKTEEERLQQIYDRTLEEAIDNLDRQRSGINAEKENERLMYSVTPQQDADYMDAVNRGDMETAQRMVNEAAKAAMPNTKVVDENGNPLLMSHNTNNEGFYTFDKGRIGTGQGQAFLGIGFNFSRGYGSSTYGNRNISAYLNAENPLRSDSKTLSKRDIRSIILELNKKNGVDRIEDSWGSMNDAVDALYDYGGDLDVYATIGMTYSGESVDVMDAFAKRGYDSTIEYNDNGEIMNAVVFDSNQIKSADSVTYDDQGNVIPLSERFNPNNDDIRYSVSSAAKDVLDKWENQDGSSDYPYLTNDDLVDMVDENEYLNSDDKLALAVYRYRKLKQEDYEEGMRDYSGGEADDLVENELIPRIEELASNNLMYSFIGERGAERMDVKERAMTRVNSLADAKKLEELLGKSEDAARKIKFATGWERGKDGKWRYEIQDIELNDDSDLVKWVEGNGEEPTETTTLDQIINKDSEILKAYPQFASYDVYFVNDADNKYIALFHEGDKDSDPAFIINKAYASDFTKERIRKIMTHELQHAIQAKEGFARGGNPNYIAQAVKGMDNNAKIWGYIRELESASEDTGLNGEEELYNEIVNNRLGDNPTTLEKEGWIPNEDLRKVAYRAWSEGRDTSKYEKSYEQWYKRLRENGMTFWEADPVTLYRSLAGEVEARNASKRIEMTSDERRQILAAETEDVAREDQLIMMAGDPILYSVAKNANTPQERMALYDALVGTKNETSTFVGRTMENAYQYILDGAIPLKRLQTVVAGRNGVKDAENAYLMEIARASRAKYLTDQAEKKYMQPMMDAIADLTGKQNKRGFYKAMRDVELYVLAKSGIERNQWFWDEAKKKDPKAQLEDKSGLTALAAQFGETDFTAFAERLVAEYEAKHGKQKIDNLWNAIRNMSHNILDTERDGMLISAELCEDLKNRWQYYVPMRGFDEDVTSSVYSYDPSSANIRFENPFKKIKGRVSLADNPFVNLWRMTESAINLKGKNEVGLALLTLASNHPDNGLLRVGKSWETRFIDPNTGEEKWMMAYPNLANVNQKDIPAAIDAFQKSMVRMAKTGDARQSNSRTAGGMRIFPTDMDQHTLKVTVAGQSVDLYLMGNPKAFQSLNPNGKNRTAQAMSALTRGLSGLMTTYNPVFMVRNSMRDLGTAMIITYTRDGVGGMATMLGQWFSNANRLRRLISGKPSGDATIDQYWNEFLEFGGETGFTRSLAMEKARDEFMKDMRNATRKGINPNLVFHAYGNWMENYGNRFAEDITRFAVFCASRKQGKSAMQAAADAKNTTANFNKKGNSAFTRFMTSNFAFFNAALQGLNTTFHAYKDNPGRAAVASVSTMVFSMALPFINMCMLALFGDDDDWRQYENMTQFIGNTHLVAYIPKTGFVTLPFPQDFVPLTALGNIIWRNAAGFSNIADERSIAGNIMLEWASTMADLLPVNMFEEGFGKIEDWEGVARAVAPTWLSPVADVMLNRNFMGSMIRRKHFLANGQKDLKPYWAEYDRNKSEWAYELAKLIAGGDEYRAAAEWRNIDPRQIIHIVEGYGGGTVKLISDAANYATARAKGENASINQSPFIKKFWIQPQPDKYEGNLNGKLYEMAKHQRDLEQELKALQKEADKAYDDGNDALAEKREKEIERIENSIEYQVLSAYDVNGMMESWREQRNDITADEELSDEGKQEQIRSLTYEKAAFLDGIWEELFLNGDKSNWFSEFYRDASTEAYTHNRKEKEEE